MSRHFKPVVPEPKHPTIKVVFFRWVDSVLDVVEDLIEDLDEAIHRATDTPCHSYKVYNRHGHVVRSGRGGNHHSHGHHWDDSPYC